MHKTGFLIFTFLMMIQPVVMAADDILPLPLSIHQSESEFYGRFDADTEKEWDETKASRREDLSKTESIFPRGGASSPGPFLLEKEVFGWHPYWEGSDYTNYTFNLLSTVAYFSYEVDPATGYALTMRSWSNTPLVEWAHSNNVDVVLTVTLFSGHSNFFASASSQSNLINELVRVIQLRNADGVNIDFEAVPGGSRNLLTAFMSNLTIRMHADVSGSQVSICLPAVDWSSNFDVAAYNGFLDKCIMMGYDYSWSTDSQAGPVAPLTGSSTFGSYCVMKSVSNYLNLGLSPGKLLLGCPYYGFDWPTVSHSLHADTTGAGTSRKYPAAESYAATYGYNWDTNSLTPYVLYDTYRQIWYDDTDSLSLKYDFSNSKNLAGIGIWALGYDDNEPELWDLLADKFATTNLPWIEQNSGTAGSFYGAGFGADTFAAVGSTGMIYSSSNTTDWIARTSGTSRLLLNVEYGGGLFAAVGDAGVIQTSPDGAGWTTRSSTLTNMLRGVAYGSNTFVVAGNDGAIASSENGISWTSRSSGTSAGLQSVVFGEDQFVAVGNTGLVITSPDGTTWTTRVSGVSNWLLDVCHGSNLFVAVGTGGKIITSADGISWTARTSGTADQLYRICYGDGTFITVGIGGMILRSSNGLDWTNEWSGVTNRLRGTAYGGGAFVAAGYEGTILTRGQYTGTNNIPIDSDGDGIPDWWETLHFGTATGAVASTDSDGDDASNWAEWIALTVPTNIDSVFIIDADPEVAGGNHIVYWPSASNRTYTLYWNTNLSSEFSVMEADISATPPMNTHTDSTHNGESIVYYTVEAEE